MKRNATMIVLVIVAILIINQLDLFTDSTRLAEFISGNRDYAPVLFVALWIFRLVLFIPGVTLMILGGVFFEPFPSILLSIVGMVLSETVVYLFATVFSYGKLTNRIERKYPELKKMLEKYNYRFLALGILNPVAPTDVICYLSASIGVSYWLYIATVIVANIPLMILYSYFGISVGHSVVGIVLTVLSFVLITAISMKIWHDLKVRGGAGHPFVHR